MRKGSTVMIKCTRSSKKIFYRNGRNGCSENEKGESDRNGNNGPVKDMGVMMCENSTESYQPGLSVIYANDDSEFGKGN